MKFLQLCAKKYLLIALFIAPFISNQSLAQKDSDWTNLTTANTTSGLPSDEVLDLKFDSKGTLWLATEVGLVKYDGKTWKLFGKKEGFTDNGAMQNVFINTKDRVFAASRTEGFFEQKADGSFEHFNYDENSSEITINDFLVQDIVEDEKGGYYIASSMPMGDKLSYRSSDNKWKTFTYSLISNNPFINIMSLAYDKANKVLYIGTDMGGLVKYDGAKFTPVPEVATGGVSKVIVASDGKVYAATDLGLAIISSEKTEIINKEKGLPETFVRSVGEAPDKTIWIGMADSGIGHKKADGEWEFFTKKDGLSSNDVYSFAFSPKTKLPFLGMHLGGVCYKKEDGEWGHWASQGLSSNGVKSMYIDGEDMIFATNSGISIKSGKVWKNHSMLATDTKEGLTSNFCRNVIVDKDKKNIWVAVFEGGIAKYNKTFASWQFFTPVIDKKVDSGNGEAKAMKPSATDVYCDKDGTIWITTYGSGIGRFNAKEKKFELFYDKNTPEIPESVNSFFKIVEAPNGDLWFCSVAGILKRSGEKYTFDKYPTKVMMKNPETGEPQETEDNNVRNVAFDKEGNAWICKMAGIVIQKGGEQEILFGTPDMPMEYVANVAFNTKGEAFVATLLNGLCLVTKDRKYYKMGESVGLPAELQIYDVEIKDGKLYLLTDKGIFIHSNPDKLSELAITETTSMHQEDRFFAYPNPSKGRIQFPFLMDKVSVYSLDGLLVYSGKNIKELDLSFCAKGIYVICSEKGNQKLRERIVLE